MQKRAIPILIVVMSLSLIGVVIMQYLWIEKAVSEKQALIDNNVQQVVAKVEEQLNDQRAMNFINGDDLDLPDLGISALLGPLSLGIEHHEQINVLEDGDSTIKMEIQVLTAKDSIKWNDAGHNFNSKIEKHIYADLDSISLIEVNEGLGQLETVINKIKFELLGDGPDKRLDSTTVAELLNDELQSKGLGNAINWGIFDNETAKYIIFPQYGAHMIDYSIPLFTSDVIHPGRYNLQLALNKNDLIWKEIWAMVILSIVCLLIITVVFAFSIKLVIKHKKISQIKSDFINNMTHEFKTPLASISLAADSILHPNNELTRTNVEKYVGIIQSEKNKLNAQVERILEVASLSKDALEIQVENIALTEVIHRAIAQFQIQLETESIEISTNLSELRVVANTFHLENVIVNLIDNSIKYSEGKAHISISANEEGQIVITDKGIGMDNKQLSKVFDHFYRAQSGNLHNTKGFGLGLSYCKLVIEKMGGQIFLESKLNEGTKAVIKLQKV